MLAYVFWHWRRPEVEAAAYARHLVSFHRALGRLGPPGLVGSVAFRGAAAPWLPGEESYEDWYLIEGSDALDPLNEWAVSGPCREPHDTAARAAAGGTAGLYRLRLGVPDVGRARWTVWFRKPADLSYRDFYSRLAPLAAGPQVGLWGRQMVLGPTPEFCLMAPAPVAWSAGFLEGVTRALEPLWPAS